MILSTVNTNVYEFPNYSIVNTWLILIFMVALMVGGFFLLRTVIMRKSFYIIYFSIFLSIIAFYCLGLQFLSYILIAALAVIICAFLFSNLAELRPFMSNTLNKKQVLSFHKNNVSQPIFDRDAMLDEIEEAVRYFSSNRVGALITFERKTKLDDVIKSGTLVNAPVTSELLETIFYVGTRLHDGAVVIRGNMILAAAVYYTPTTKPLTGKYGSRHRAAIGISEISDSVTVVVSEETGRISIAYRGEIYHVSPDKFLRELKGLLDTAPDDDVQIIEAMKSHSETDDENYKKQEDSNDIE